MPQGGLSQYGGGLQLQSSTPGVSNQGNAHISGTMIADTAIYSNKPVTGAGTTFYNQSFGAVQTWSNYWQLSTAIGSRINMTNPQAVNLNTTGDSVAIGYFINCMGGKSVAVGSSSKVGDAGNTAGNSLDQDAVAIGYFAEAYYTGTVDLGPTVIGSSAYAKRVNRSVVLGAGAGVSKAAGTLQNVVWIGVGQTSATIATGNTILIDSNSTNNVLGDLSNTIQIGNNAHTTIKLGPINFNKPSITGSRGGNAALTDLLTKLAAMNIIIDTTTA